MAGPIEVKNRKAGFEYHLLDTFECGMVLMGSEIKSIRNNGATIGEAYCAFVGDDLMVRGMQINPWGTNPHYVHEPKRDRKLLLHKKQINKLIGAIQREGRTVVPLQVYFNPRGRAKIEIALATGKQAHDKRQSIKDRDWQRQRARMMSSRR